MLCNTSALSRSASRWAFQLSTSLGATLIAALIIHAVPRSAADAPAPAPELTSGGKFAARVPSAHAYDGLDRMPLPRIDAPPAIPAAFLTSPPADLGGNGAALREPSRDAPASHERARSARPVRTAPRAEARRLVAPLEAASATAAAATPLATAPGVDSAPDDGLLHEVASTTRAAWTLTASASGSLLSRLIAWRP